MREQASMRETDQLRALAELIVRFGANVQPGQILAISSEPGKEPLVRAIAQAAYRHGAKFVDLSVFDVHLKRARAMYANPETLDFVPPWLGQRVLALGEHRCARVALSGPVEPHLMAGIDPELLGRDMLPSVPEGIAVVNERTTNWTVAPCPTPTWAELVYPQLDPSEAFERIWDAIAHVCRLDEPDPVSAWESRLDQLTQVARKLEALELEALRFEGPGTDLTVGLMPGSRWVCGRFSTIDGIPHAPNVPTEEVFTTPDPDRTEGYVQATKPLFVSGVVITGLRVRFEGGRATEIEADEGGGTLQALSRRDAGAARLGEVALVDREGRIGPLDTVFFDTLLDENAASHIALGQGYELAVEGERDLARINQSEIHIDFMIGSDELSVTGVSGGSEVPLLRDGTWQI
ncbi:MAG: aminopeptidase [Solirubrobacterales bacterium]|nr:aminopeptidase [Solirubrobacterales bacterium]